MDHNPDDYPFMQEALRVGRTALARSSPNPAVGAVVVRDTGIIGRGATQPAGKAHAEVVALGQAGPLAAGSTLYVTLEPCCHFGRTPPCVDAIIDTSISRCVIALPDPFPLVCGEGIARLRAAGITVDTGVATSEAAEDLGGYLNRIRTGRPLVRAKYAMTLDGNIATYSGDSRWITGPQARRRVHQIRDRADAIIVGAGTVRTDDPSLTTRLPASLAGYGGPHHPLRIVVDSGGRIPASSRLFDATLPGRTMVVTTNHAQPDWLHSLARRGIEFLVCGQGPQVDLGSMLDMLGERGLNEVVVEGGGRLLGSFFEAGLVDRVAAFVAPVITGGAGAPGPVGGQGCETLSTAWRLSDVRITTIDDDVLVEGAVASARASVGAA